MWENPQTVVFLLTCLVGMVAFFGVTIVGLLIRIAGVIKSHGERLTRLETRAEIIRQEVAT